MSNDIFKIDKKVLKSRLIVGTGKYKNMAQTANAIKASGADMVTVAVRRVNISDKKKPLLMDYVNPKKIIYLPNTAGCFNAAEALRTLRLAREIGGWKMVKLEILGDKKTLYPDMIETIKTTKVLVKEGFLKYFPLGLLLMSIFLTELIIVFKDLEFFSSNNSGISISNLLNQGHENTKSIGLFLYTDFFIIFQISGYLLLVAMIGAIVLAHDNKLSLKSQNILKQKLVKKDDIIKLK